MEETEDAMVQGEQVGNNREAKDDELDEGAMEEDKSFLTKIAQTQTLYFGFIVTVIDIEHFIFDTTRNISFLNISHFVVKAFCFKQYHM